MRSDVTHFQCGIDGGIATVRLDRPDRKNPLTFDSYAELRDWFRDLVYADDVDAVEGYLQRCVFDDTASLNEMLSTEPLGEYLRGCRDTSGWRFGQRARLMTVTV